MFRLETDLRKWMRDGLGDKARWVEPARGSTIGLPDCWMPIDGSRVPVWVELKVADVKGNRLVFTIRPEQRKQLTSMVRDKAVVGLIAGVKYANMVLAMMINDQTMNGDVDISEGLKAGWLIELSNNAIVGPTQGVYFIFSYTMKLDRG
jgi:hypothetical protein